MFIRLIGKENEALGQDWSHPFTDVPTWADKYIGWAFVNGYTKGISETEFGTGNIQAKSFMTFSLRALGYDDSKGDFSWDDSLEFSREKRVIDQQDLDELKAEKFLRDHVANISCKVLKAKLKENKKTLAEKLVESKAIDEKIAKEIEVIKTNGAEIITDKDGYVIKDFAVQGRNAICFSIHYNEYQGRIDLENKNAKLYIDGKEILPMHVTSDRDGQNFYFILRYKENTLPVAGKFHFIYEKVSEEGEIDGFSVKNFEYDTMGNNVPYIISNYKDTQFKKDIGDKIKVDLNKCVFDPEGDKLSFRVEYDESDNVHEECLNIDKNGILTYEFSDDHKQVDDEGNEVPVKRVDFRVIANDGMADSGPIWISIKSGE